MIRAIACSAEACFQWGKPSGEHACLSASQFVCELLLTPLSNTDIYGTLFSLSLTMLSDGVRLRLPVPAEPGPNRQSHAANNAPL